MNGRLTLYIDQWGNRYYAHSTRTILKHMIRNRIDAHWAAKRATALAEVQSTLGLAA